MGEVGHRGDGIRRRTTPAPSLAQVSANSADSEAITPGLDPTWGDAGVCGGTSVCGGSIGLVDVYIRCTSPSHHATSCHCAVWPPQELGEDSGCGCVHTPGF